MPPRYELGVPVNLVRFSVGLEDINDIINDLDQALRTAVWKNKQTIQHTILQPTTLITLLYLGFTLIFVSQHFHHFIKDILKFIRNFHFLKKL
jgi:hypothetical protein